MWLDLWPIISHSLQWDSWAATSSERNCEHDYGEHSILAGSSPTQVNALWRAALLRCVPWLLANSGKRRLTRPAGWSTWAALVTFKQHGLDFVGTFCFCRVRMQAFPFLDRLLPSQDWAGWVLPGIKGWHPTVGPTASTTVRQFLVHLPAPGISNCRSRKKALYKVWLTYENIPLFLQYNQSHLARSPDLPTYKVKIATKTMKAFVFFFFCNNGDAWLFQFGELEIFQYLSLLSFLPPSAPPY